MYDLFLLYIKHDTGDTNRLYQLFTNCTIQMTVSLSFLISLISIDGSFIIFITANKSQKHSFDQVGIYVDGPFFNHGQYVSYCHDVTTE